jgi:hypothetical protein
VGRIREQEPESGSRLHQIRGEATSSLNFQTTNTSQDIKHKTARREFCGPGKRIPLAVMNKLDKDIETSKRSGDKALKKQLKRKYVDELLLRNVR